METDLHHKITGGYNIEGYQKESWPGYPLVSIITAVHNEKDALERTIWKIRDQNYYYIELIIIDGASTDGTLDVLKQYNRDIAFWMSEKDNGIYDAMNKGIKFANGEWIYFFGVDDSFYQNDTLNIIFGKSKIPESILVLLGNVIYPNGRIFKSKFNKMLYMKNSIHHQGIFYRKEIFTNYQYGPNPTGKNIKQFYISGDYQLNFMLFLQGIDHSYTDTIVAKCGNGISMQGKMIGYLEEILIRHQMIGLLKSSIFDVFSLLRYIRKRFVLTIANRKDL